MAKKLFLTIDDFPTSVSGELICFLTEKRIPAVIFCIGENLKNNISVAVQALEHGLILGNHSYTHPHFSGITVQKAVEEIRKTDEMLGEIYHEADLPWSQKYFRFPYGDKGDGMKGMVFQNNPADNSSIKNQIQEELIALNYTHPIPPGITYSYYRNDLARDRDIHWTLDGMEWCLKRKNGLFSLRNTTDIIDRLFSENPFDCRGVVPEKNYGMQYAGSDEILLLHDHPVTIGVFKSMVDEVLRRGFGFHALVESPYHLTSGIS